ncbi:hypothetical protein OQA88_8041 [Cercophora sp. LCS_1]
MGRQLEDFPVELLNEICSHLCPHCRVEEFSRRSHTALETRRSKAGLAALCRTSKGLQGIAEPYLYHFVDQNGGTQSRTLPWLVQRITSRPDLAKHVKRLDFAQTVACSVPEELVAHLSDAAARCNLNLPDWWHQSWEKAVLVLLELLLLHTPNASTLHLTPTLYLNFAHFSRSKETLNHAHVLPGLTTLFVKRDAEASNEWVSIKPLLEAATNLKRLTLRGSRYRSRYRDFLSDGLTFEHLTDLSFYHCTFTSAYIGNIIIACSRLEVFHATLEYSPTEHPHFFLAHNEDGGTWFSLHTIMSSLRKHKRTLRVFSFDTSKGRPQLPENSHHFRDFEKLESVQMTLADFKSVDDTNNPSDTFLIEMLPESIKRLQLVDPAENITSNLWELNAALDRGSFPNLVELGINSHASHDDPGEEKSDVAVQMVALGVAFGLRQGFKFSGVSDVMNEWR